MSLAIALTLALSSQASVQAVDAAYPEMSEARYAEAIEKIGPDGDSAAQLINLGVAYAREGDVARAREAFQRALAEEPVMLETAKGEWRDSRRIAWQMLARLDRGDMGPVRTASR